MVNLETQRSRIGVCLALNPEVELSVQVPYLKDWEAGLDCRQEVNYFRD